MSKRRITGSEIMAWRKGLGQPRKWLADLLGVSPKTIESWEYGTRNPSGPAIRLLGVIMNQKNQNELRNSNDAIDD